MANDLTDYLEAAIIDFFFRPGATAPTRPTSVKVALITTDTNAEAGTVAEASYAGYAALDFGAGASAQNAGLARTSNTATSLLPAAAASPKIVLPADYLQRVGQRMRICATGRVSNIVTTPGTLTLDIRFGSTVIANGGAMALNTVAKTNVSWELWWEFTLRSIGTAAQWFHTGSWVSESVVGSAAGAANCCSLPSSAPALGTAFDSSASQAIDLFGTWSLNNANSIQCHQFAVYLSN